MAPSASRGACAEPCPLEGNHVQVPGVTGDVLSKDNTLRWDAERLHQLER